MLAVPDDNGETPQVAKVFFFLKIVEIFFMGEYHFAIDSRIWYAAFLAVAIAVGTPRRGTRPPMAIGSYVASIGYGPTDGFNGLSF